MKIEGNGKKDKSKGAEGTVPEVVPAPAAMASEAPHEAVREAPAKPSPHAAEGAEDTTAAVPAVLAAAWTPPAPLDEAGQVEWDKKARAEWDALPKEEKKRMFAAYRDREKAVADAQKVLDGAKKDLSDAVYAIRMRAGHAGPFLHGTRELKVMRRGETYYFAAQAQPKVEAIDD